MEKSNLKRKRVKKFDLHQLGFEQSMLYLGKSQEDMLSYFSLIDGKINPSDREQPLNCIEPFKCALISDFFFTLAQISKLRYRITVLSTIYLKRICLVIWHLFWRFESKWKTFRYLKEIDLSF